MMLVHTPFMKSCSPPGAVSDQSGSSASQAHSAQHMRRAANSPNPNHGA